LEPHSYCPRTHRTCLGIIASLLYVALVEELTKFIAVRVKAYSSPHFSEVAAGLGFATLEDVVYILQSGLFVALTRAFFFFSLSTRLRGLGGDYGMNCGFQLSHWME